MLAGLQSENRGRLELTHLGIIRQGQSSNAFCFSCSQTDLPVQPSLGEGLAIQSPSALTPVEALPKPGGFPLHQFSHMKLK